MAWPKVPHARAPCTAPRAISNDDAEGISAAGILVRSTVEDPRGLYLGVVGDTVEWAAGPDQRRKQSKSSSEGSAGEAMDMLYTTLVVEY